MEAVKTVDIANAFTDKTEEEIYQISEVVPGFFDFSVYKLNHLKKATALRTTPS